jgi:hypothetical protein
MTEESAAALEAAPETVVEAPEGEATEGQIEGQAAEGEDPEEAKKSEAAKRREREKAYRARLQSEAAEAKAEAEQARARRQAILDAGKKEAPPKESDFPDPLEFAAAKAIWGAEGKYREREANGAGEAATAAEQRAKDIEARERAVIEQSWTTQLAEAKAKYSDFEAVALSDEVPVTPVMGDLIKTSDVGADVAYHLGQNRALAAQIAKMNPLDAARAIGRIEASLQQPKARTETNAPPPISPVRGSASAPLNPDKMSMQDYVAARRAGKIR